jgi:hypothetical protein
MRPWHTSLAMVSTALLAGGLASTVPVQAQYDSVTSPSRGVLCDRASQICYDREGISLGLTRKYYGPGAERKLMGELSGRPTPKEFRLSNGAVCSVPMGLCWSDGFAKRQVSREMSRDLFGTNVPGGQAHNNPDRDVTRFTGICSLAQGGRELYDGKCSLRRVSDSSGLMR